MPKTIFYARVSTREQNLDAQVDAARRLGVPDEHIYVEKLPALVTTGQLSPRLSRFSKRATR